MAKNSLDTITGKKGADIAAAENKDLLKSVDTQLFSAPTEKLNQSFIQPLANKFTE